MYQRCLSAIVLAVAACGPGEPAPIRAPVPEETRPKLRALELPTASHGLPLATSDDVVRVEVVNARVSIDGKQVGEASTPSVRIDGLYHSLETFHDSWKASHSGGSFAGLARLAIDRETSLSAVKSLFQTVAYAGYPYASLVVRLPDGTEAELPVHAIVHGSPPPEDERPNVDVRATPESTVFAFSKNGAVASTLSVPWADLEKKVETEWSHGPHVESGLDRAVLYVKDIDYPRLITLVDALQPMTHVDASLAIETEPLPPDSTALPASLGTNQEVAEQIIQRVIRSHYAALTKCADSGKGQGRVVVKLTIALDGKVSSATADDSTTLTDKTAVACILAGFEKITFPRPSGGHPITVEWPLELRK